jgi:hypothetical protein
VADRGWRGGARSGMGPPPCGSNDVGLPPRQGRSRLARTGQGRSGPRYGDLTDIGEPAGRGARPVQSGSVRPFVTDFRSDHRCTGSRPPVQGGPGVEHRRRNRFPGGILVPLRGARPSRCPPRRWPPESGLPAATGHPVICCRTAVGQHQHRAVTGAGASVGHQEGRVPDPAGTTLATS